MAEAALELRAILEAAERAAAADDFVSAEQHLRQAAALQETQLGAAHPDLANTLNNLGIVSEHVGKPADAEACYRRAYRIASAALPADHPLVQTSGQNLRDFCAATGKPFEVSEPLPAALRPTPAPVSAPVPTAPPSKPKPVARAIEPPAPAPPLRLATETRTPAPPPRPPTAAMRTASPVSTSESRPTMAIAIAAVLLITSGTWWFGFRQPSGPVAPSSPRIETAAPREEPQPPVTSAAPAPAPVPAATEKPAPVEVPIEKPPIAAAPTKPVARQAAASSSVSVAEAKLCRSLSTSNWACTAAMSPAAPGAFYFYTRVQSSRDTTVQHRWLLNGRLLRSVSLRVGANPGAGFRTYSRNTVIAERRGEWTIELRDAGGALLHEERFTVQ